MQIKTEKNDALRVKSLTKVEACYAQNLFLSVLDFATVFDPQASQLYT
jgi:hypothetical protein